MILIPFLHIFFQKSEIYLIIWLNYDIECNRYIMNHLDWILNINLEILKLLIFFNLDFSLIVYSCGDGIPYIYKYDR